MPPLPDSDWTTNYPTSQDTGVNAVDQQPDLTDDTTPSAEDGHRTRTSHPEALRDKLHAMALKVGDDSSLPAGCLEARAPTADQKAALAGTGTPAAGDVYVNDSDSRMTDKRTASALGTTGADVNVDAAAPPTTGQVLKATGATTATWQAEAGGGGGSSVDYDAQIASIGALGTETFTVATMVANANIPGGFDLHYCVVNGLTYKIVTTVPAGRECRVTASTTIEVANVQAPDEVEFLFGV